MSAWAELIRIAGALPEPLRRAPLVQEQLAFALNRAGRGEEAERVLLAALGPRLLSAYTSLRALRVVKQLSLRLSRLCGEPV